MKCLKCGGKTGVADLVHTENNETYRRKECRVCKHEFYTIEFEIECDEKLSTEWGKFYRNGYVQKRNANQYKPRNYINGTTRKYERLTESDREYMMEHCYENPEIVAKHLDKKITTVRANMYKYRKERRKK